MTEVKIYRKELHILLRTLVNWPGSVMIRGICVEMDIPKIVTVHR